MRRTTPVEIYAKVLQLRGGIDSDGTVEVDMDNMGDDNKEWEEAEFLLQKEQHEIEEAIKSAEESAKRQKLTLNGFVVEERTAAFLAGGIVGGGYIAPHPKKSLFY